MEYIDGGSLRSLMSERGGKLGARESVAVIRQVLTGLAAIHARGIVHRDLKPENVLVGTDGIARIADFGIASVADQIGLTTTGTTFGTAAYMAPEQGRGDAVTPATDLYAAGVMLFEMISGRLPFQASTIVAMLMAHQNDRPPALTSISPELQDQHGLSDVIQQAMAKEPGRRFRSANAMIAALDQPFSADARTLQVQPTPRVEQTMTMPVQPRPVRAGTPPPPGGTAPVERGGGGGWIWTLLILIAVGAVAAYLAMQYLDDGDEDNGPLAPVPTRTAQAPTEEDDPDPEPTETSVQIIEPIETSTPEPEATETEEIIEEPTSTIEPEPTEEIETPTEESVIEPVEGSPTETETPDGAPTIESI